ncbi:MAG: aminotransferase class V-fold PLP-dependent enzyme [Deltaproteobacteria bacterium]|nr:aminotransferase class V-fold PLP-dependent enzyme [Deltaproteobacteria bacterium]
MTTGSAPAPQLGDRSLFPHLQVPYYANFAAISPPSQPVEQAVAAQVRDVAERGSGSFVTWIGARKALKEQLASLIGAHADDLGLAPNTTMGVAAIAFGIDLHPGDRILCVRGEFPANVVPWQQAARRFGATVDFLPAPEAFATARDWLNECSHLLPAKILAVSAVRFDTGWRAPLAELAELCHRHGTQLAVDAVQAVGVVPLDVTALGVDYLACGSHKWLMAPEGSGLLYVRPGLAEALHKTLAGWLSVADPADFLTRGPGLLRYDKPVRDRADFLEGANLAASSCAGLAASVTILQRIGVSNIYQHVQQWHDALEPYLLRRGFTSLRPREAERRSGILACRPPAGVDVVALQARLAEHGVSCSIPNGNLRFSAHWPSPLAEVAGLTDRLEQALAELPHST